MPSGRANNLLLILGEVLRCPHKRIVTITKVYIAKNNIHVEIIRFRKKNSDFIDTRTGYPTHVRNRVCPRVELILKIIIIVLIIFLGFIKGRVTWGMTAPLREKGILDMMGSR